MHASTFPTDGPLPGPDAPLKPLKVQELGLAAFSGVVLAMGFPGVDLGFLAWVALVPFCLAAFQPRRKRAMMGLFAAFGGAFYLTLLYWFLAMHPLTWLGFTVAESIGVVSGVWLGASVALMVQLAVLGFAFGWVSQRWGAPSWKHVVALATGWTALEWLSSLGTFGFTWGNLALTQHQYLPLIQVLDLVGAFPLAGLIVAVNGALAVGLARQWGKPFTLSAWKPLAPALALVAAVLGYGAFRLAQPLPATTFSTEIVQGNFAGGEKWAKGMDPHAFIRKTAEKYLRLTQEHPDTDLVLWPETALPTYLRSDYETINRLTEETVKHKRYLMTGTINYDGTQEAYHLYNAVTAFGPRGENLGFDAKRHLVPFGEYLPGRELLPKFIMDAFGLMNIVGHDFTPGATPHLFEFPFGKVGIGVCYDGIFPDAMRPAVLQGAEILALVTNDSWYKDTTAPRVLNAHAALRAVESRRYILRAANTGICSIIEPTGRVVATTPVFKDATLVGRASPMHELTLYTRWGDWASILASLGFLAFLVTRWTTRNPRLPAQA